MYREHEKLSPLSGNCDFGPAIEEEEEEEDEGSFFDLGMQETDEENANVEETEDDIEDSEISTSHISQWPQSYRQSMDIYSHMASPRSLLSNSFMSTSYKQLPSVAGSLQPPEEALTIPLLPGREENLLTDSQSIPRLSSFQKAFSECQLSLPQGGCSFMQATLNGFNVMAGVGVLSTPYALKEGGWIGLCVLMLFSAICCYTGVLLRRCLDSQPGLITYPDIGQAAFGNLGRIIISVVLYIELYASCVEFLILEGDNLSSLFPSAKLYFLETQQLFVLVAALFILPTVWLRNLSLLSYLSAGGVIASLVVAFTVLWIGAVDTGFHNEGKLIDLGNLPVAIGLFGYCFSGHAVFPNIYSSMRNKNHFNYVLLICFTLCSIMYAGVATMGYMMFGEEAESQVTLNLPKQHLPSKIALWSTVITPFSKFALTMTPVALSLEELLPNEYTLKHHWASMTIRTGLVASTVCVSLLIPFFGFVMAFIGSFLSMTGCIILPCACYMSIQRKRLPVLQGALCVTIITIGLLAAIAGTYSAVDGIVSKMHPI